MTVAENMSDCGESIEEGDAWADFGDFQGSGASGRTSENGVSVSVVDTQSRSFEDSVREQISGCFRNDSSEIDRLQPVTIQNQRDLISGSP